MLRYGLRPEQQRVWRSSLDSLSAYRQPDPLEVQDHLGLVYGAFFGFICRHEPMLYTRLGQVKDDLERTLRYWDRDRIVLRFCHYACRTWDAAELAGCVLSSSKFAQVRAKLGQMSASLGPSSTEIGNFWPSPGRIWRNRFGFDRSRADVVKVWPDFRDRGRLEPQVAPCQL